MTDLLRTACGLRVLPGERPRNWGPFTWVQEVQDLAGTLEDDVALMMIRAELLTEVAMNDNDIWSMPLDLAFASLHDGDVPRVDSGGRLDYADPEVPSQGLSVGLYQRTRRPYTICGIIEGTWRSICELRLAPDPQTAYLWTWIDHQDQGEYLLLAAVHEGEVRDISGFDYADGGNSITAVEALARDGWGVQ